MIGHPSFLTADEILRSRGNLTEQPQEQHRKQGERPSSNSNESLRASMPTTAKPYASSARGTTAKLPVRMKVQNLSAQVAATFAVSEAMKATARPSRPSKNANNGANTRAASLECYTSESSARKQQVLKSECVD
jgi:hypothetical protein